ncbi:BAR/IMD domain-containing adapter protein 2-like 2 isoform X2 [Ascaphus truei]|uniref:BAR/IMD domain-containing adapter protein 2-like 2 isoform X2 n=1 Tax=Ascaphus truei TaxID=8439 RepID=UPI003F59C8BF
MSREMDSVYNATIGTYKKILSQFNPALENLVYLGNNYLRALNALSETANVYFNAIKKIGEQALQSDTCHGLGQLLVQMADTCKHASAGLDVVFQTLHVEILQHMDKNTKLDMHFIHDSQTRYEMEFRHRASSLDECMEEARRMEKKRDRNLREMKENMTLLRSDMLSFARDSQRAAEQEEKRRYRFLAERHWLLGSTFLQYHSRAQGVLQARVPSWKEQVDASRTQTGSVPPAQGQMPSRLAGNPRDALQRPLSDILPSASRGASPAEREPSEVRASAKPDTTKRGLQRTPSIGSLGSSQFRSRSNSFGEVAVAAVAAASASVDSTRVQALVDHNPGANLTLLQFAKGDVIAVLVQEARNGWLYGRLEGQSKTGWFPEAYVKSLDREQDTRSLRSAHSTGDLLEASNNIPQPAYRPTPREPGPSNPSSRRGSEATVAPASQPIRSNTGKKMPSGSRGELFPRGTNPFATVKLRPTVTNDRSAPHIR